MTARKFKRGEARRISVEAIEANIRKPFEEIVTIVAEALGFSKTKSRGHIRWLHREGYINDKGGATKDWPKRSGRVKKAVAKKATGKKTTAKKVVKPAKQVAANAAVPST